MRFDSFKFCFCFCFWYSLLTAAVIYVIYLLIKALREVYEVGTGKKGKAEDAKTLGEVLKNAGWTAK